LLRAERLRNSNDTSRLSRPFGAAALPNQAVGRLDQIGCEGRE